MCSIIKIIEWTPINSLLKVNFIFNKSFPNKIATYRLSCNLQVTTIKLVIIKCKKSWFGLLLGKGQTNITATKWITHVKTYHF